MEGKRVDSKLLLFTLVLVLITLLLLNWLLGNNRTNGIWDYKEIITAASIIYQGERVEDRETYYILESIIQEYLNSYVDTYSENNKQDKLVYTDYYDYLTEGYRKYLSKNEYNQLAEKFLSKFYVNANSEYETMNYMDIEQIIKAIYLLEDNVYLCELKGKYTQSEGYIAIALDKINSTYNIVYIE